MQHSICTVKTVYWYVHAWDECQPINMSPEIGLHTQNEYPLKVMGKGVSMSQQQKRCVRQGKTPRAYHVVESTYSPMSLLTPFDAQPEELMKAVNVKLALFLSANTRKTIAQIKALDTLKTPPQSWRYG